MKVTVPTIQKYQVRVVMMRHRARCVKMVAKFEISGSFLSVMVFSKADRAIIVKLSRKDAFAFH